MSRPPRTAPSLTEWAALGLLCEAPSHGWAIAQALAPDGEIGRVYSCARPLVYRAFGQLREAGLAEVRGQRRATPARRARSLGPTRRGRAAFGRWRGRPVDHVRDLRSELMLKLLFCDRAGRDSAPLLRAQAQLLARTDRSLERQLESITGFSRTLVLWRLSVARAALSFVDALLDRHTVEPIVYRPIGYVSSPHGQLDGMPLQAIADSSGESTIELTETHRGCLVDLDGFSHVWVVAHLHESLGWDATVPAFLDDRAHGTFATRSPHRPNPVGLSLARIVAVGESRSWSTGSTSSTGRRSSTSSRSCPSSIRPRPRPMFASGWFEGRAERVFRRRSDDRFALRSRQRCRRGRDQGVRRVMSDARA